MFDDPVHELYFALALCALVLVLGYLCLAHRPLKAPPAAPQRRPGEDVLTPDQSAAWGPSYRGPAPTQQEEEAQEKRQEARRRQDEFFYGEAFAAAQARSHAAYLQATSGGWGGQQVTDRRCARAWVNPVLDLSVPAEARPALYLASDNCAAQSEAPTVVSVE